MESASNGLNEAATASYPTIAATATALPPYTITREDVKVYMGRVFDIPERRLEAMMSIVDNAQVHNRHSIFRAAPAFANEQRIHRARGEARPGSGGKVPGTRRPEAD